MKNVIKNWKTSLLGGGAIAGAVTHFVQNPNDWKQSAFMALVGILGLFAKDSDVTHTNNN